MDKGSDKWVLIKDRSVRFLARDGSLWGMTAGPDLDPPIRLALTPTGAVVTGTVSTVHTNIDIGCYEISRSVSKPLASFFCERMISFSD